MDEPKADAEESKIIGISMPTNSSGRWITDGNCMIKESEALGHKADLHFGEDIIDNQQSQLENMLIEGADALVIAAIDGEALTKILPQAKDKNVKVLYRFNLKKIPG